MKTMTKNSQSLTVETLHITTTCAMKTYHHNMEIYPTRFRNPKSMVARFMAKMNIYKNTSHPRKIIHRLHLYPILMAHFQLELDQALEAPLVVTQAVLVQTGQIIVEVLEVVQQRLIICMHRILLGLPQSLRH